MSEPKERGASPDDVAALLRSDIPYKLGKYEIRGELGRGTCGVVYRGYDPFVRRDVAIKVGWCEAAPRAPEAAEPLDFFAEAHAAGRLQHPNIVAVYDAAMEKELKYIVMEYVEGETLLAYCRKDGPRLEPAKVVECLYKCCLALDYSHRMGVIHRDIKPSNIMLARNGETKLMDFSVAEIIHARRISPSMIVGSPSYMSPEQILRREVGPPSDLYSLAAVGYQLLTGERLFPGQDMKQIFQDILHKPAPRLADRRPDLPAALSAILERALRKSPSARYQSGAEMAADLAMVYDNLARVGREVDRDAFRSRLRALRFFTGFSDAAFAELVGAGQLLRFAPGETITREGDLDHAFYLIVEGRVQVSRAGRGLVALAAGDCFGEAAALPEGKRQTSLAALCDATVLKLNRGRLEALSDAARLDFYRAFSENLVQRLSAPQA